MRRFDNKFNYHLLGNKLIESGVIRSNSEEIFENELGICPNRIWFPRLNIDSEIVICNPVKKNCPVIN